MTVSTLTGSDLEYRTKRKLPALLLLGHTLWSQHHKIFVFEVIVKESLLVKSEVYVPQERIICRSLCIPDLKHETHAISETSFGDVVDNFRLGAGVTVRSSDGQVKKWRLIHHRILHFGFLRTHELSSSSSPSKACKGGLRWNGQHNVEMHVDLPQKIEKIKWKPDLKNGEGPVGMLLIDSRKCMTRTTWLGCIWRKIIHPGKVLSVAI